MNQDKKKQEEEEEEMPVSSFQSYAAEGDIMAKQGDFHKAIEAYTKALAVRPGEKNVLVARSRCQLQLGEPVDALEDAELALKQDPDFFKAVFQKAEALYSKGDFELALVFYHRGNRMRPELDEFRLGIQKASEAIDNSIGNPKNYKFQPPPGVRLVINDPTTMRYNRALSAKERKKIPTIAWVVPKPPTAPGHNPTATAKPEVKGKTVKQLLGELYTDREYLEGIFRDKDFSHNPNNEVKTLVDDALVYLDTRTEFWRQQKPLYARKNEHAREMNQIIAQRNNLLIAERANDHHERQRSALEQKLNPKSAGGYVSKEFSNFKVRPSTAPAKMLTRPESAQTIRMVHIGMQQVNELIHTKNYDLALRRAKHILARLREAKGVPEKDKMAVDLHHSIGYIYTKLGNFTDALLSFKSELILAKELKSSVQIIASLDEMGRLYVKSRRYKDAIKAFEERLVYTGPKSLHRAWILHDLGRCYMEVKQYERALKNGLESSQLAEQLRDNQWILNTKVLTAQAQTQLKQYTNAAISYLDALEAAKSLSDRPAIEVIQRAISEIKKREQLPNLPRGLVA
ncbi:hypothetical protein EDD86DRAFT_186113 [Gorgonomyces haynaldii]|nr:hypothetical protein EDD86DRAFT_186113 [Gorgonomyces haynaldii]